MTFKEPTMGNRISVDPSINIWNLGLLAVSIIGVIIYAVRVNDQVEDNTSAITVGESIHHDDFASLIATIGELDDDYNAQAVSVGVIQATVEFNRGTLSDISAQIQELGSNR